MESVTITAKELAKALELEILVSGRGEIELRHSEMNRPGLQFTGYYEEFAERRVQLVGNAEVHYLYDLDDASLRVCSDRFLSSGIPCVVFARDKQPPRLFLEAAERYAVPVFRSSLKTGEIGDHITRFLQYRLAPCICLHGELLDVFGVGVLLRGPSGIGKSETALEMVKGGHSLVADDVVEIRRIADTLMGSAPAATRNLIEVRGVGIMDVRYLYGVGATQPEKSIDMIVDLELWNEQTVYERTGAEDHFEEILGIALPATLLPVSPGRNLASVIGVAARSFRLKRMGYKASTLFQA
ncbi:MAG: HPr(Ser) kinase/phosphatase [Eubacteriales bacterium]|nr:HPr(Ser) kinase/phosphatase [Eubacteriales bacterium]